MFCYVFLSFVSVFLKNWAFEFTFWLFLRKICYYENMYVTISPWSQINMFNAMEAIYLNIFTFHPNIELQIISTWASTCLLFLINLFPFKLFNAESTVYRTASILHTDLKFPDKEIHFSLVKKGKTKKEWIQLYIADTQNLTLLQHDVAMLN